MTEITTTTITRRDIIIIDSYRFEELIRFSRVVPLNQGRAQPRAIIVIFLNDRGGLRPVFRINV